MGLIKCCVKNCHPKTVRRHRFPHPRKDFERFKKWIEILGLAENFDSDSIYKNKRVCPDHFEDRFKSIDAIRLHLNSYPTLGLEGSIKLNSNSEKDSTVKQIVSSKEDAIEILDSVDLSAQIEFIHNYSKSAVEPVLKSSNNVSNIFDTDSMKNNFIEVPNDIFEPSLPVQIVDTLNNQQNNTNTNSTENSSENHDALYKDIEVNSDDVNSDVSALQGSSDNLEKIKDKINTIQKTIDTVKENKLNFFQPSILKKVLTVKTAENNSNKLENTEKRTFRFDSDDFEAKSVKLTILENGKKTCKIIKDQYLESKAKYIVDKQGRKLKVVSKDDYEKVKQIKLKVKPAKPDVSSENTDNLNLEQKLDDAEQCSIILLEKNCSNKLIDKITNNFLEKNETISAPPKPTIFTKHTIQPLVLDYEYCRICAELTLIQNLMPIFDDSIKMEKINKCLQDNIQNDYGLPDKICTKCFENVENFYKFLELYKTASENLNKMINPPAKIELFNSPVDPDMSEMSTNFDSNKENTKSTEKIQHQCLQCRKILSDKDEAIRHAIQFHKFSGEGRLFFKILSAKNGLKRKFYCLTCENWFPTWTMYKRHRHKKMHFCDVCNASFLIKRDLETHKENHFNVFKCTECDQIFNKEAHLAKHKDEHPHPPVICECCNEEFSSAYMHFRHLRRKKSFLCNVCGKTFVKQNGLRNHMFIHTGGSQFQCPMCPKKFNRPSQLTSHKINHKEKNFICQMCGLRYPTQGRLNLHMRIHSDVVEFRGYKCAICDLAFKSRTSLARHKIRHEKIRDPEEIKLRNTCKVCGKVAKNGYNLKYHMLVHSDKKGPFNCQYCNRVCQTAQSLFRHVKKKCGIRPYGCNDCGRRFRLKGNLTRHYSVCKVTSNVKQLKVIVEKKPNSESKSAVTTILL